MSDRVSWEKSRNVRMGLCLKVSPGGRTEDSQQTVPHIPKVKDILEGRKWKNN